MKSIVFIFISTIIAKPLLADDCSTYAAQRGIDYEIVEGSDIPKVISTERAVPFSADIADVDDAYTEATIKAKAEIAKLLNDLIQSETRINEEANKIAKIQGEERTASSERTKQILKTMGSSSQALLRGAIPIGDCYTPGKEVRVTVGLKPETVAIATGLATGINSSLAKSQTPSNNNSTSNSEQSNSNSSNNSTSNLRETEGSNNSSRLKSF